MCGYLASRSLPPAGLMSITGISPLITGNGVGADGAENGAATSIDPIGAVRAGTGLRVVPISHIGTARTTTGTTGGTAVVFPSGAGTMEARTSDLMVSSAGTTTESSNPCAIA